MPSVSTRNGKGSRRKSHRRAAPRRRRGWKTRAVVAGVLFLAALIVWTMAERHLAPASNTSLNRFDAIIVLGYPADDDGNPSPPQLARVTEAVREYERGVAPRLIVTGGAVANTYVEAQTMARTAEAQGVPASAVLIEPSARDTIQNACYSSRIMKAHGWSSAKVVSSASHLPRAALIFSQLPLAWRTHAAPELQPQSSMYDAALGTLETLKTMRYLVWARWRERCEP